MTPILEVRSVSKKFQIRHERQPYLTLRDSLTAVFRSRAGSVEEFYALDAVSFEVLPGDTLGIIGRNGAGKTTLLRILSRITPPTAGHVIVRGRIGSLLEVGTGFHPELSGRENIFFNGAILGMKRFEIQRRFDAIVDFSGTERFLDTPLKHFSSGMQLRLAFAVAAFLEPEILVVDEVLAVGDAEFQKKCLGKMDEVSKSGRTILYVSHNMQSVSTLTRRCLYLDGGRMKALDATPKIIEQYLGERHVVRARYDAAPASERPSITRVELRTSAPGGVHLHGRAMDIEFDIHMPYAMEGMAVSFQLLNYQEQPIVHLWLFDTEKPICRGAGLHTLRCHVPRLRLYMGHYSVTAYLGETRSKTVFEVVDHICPFRVEMFGIHRDYEWIEGSCAYLEDATWTVEP